jgi:hypothetical protein
MEVSYGWTGQCRLTPNLLHITGFSSAGEDPLPLFMDKTQEKALAERMKEKYGTHRGAHWIRRHKHQ